MCDAENQQQCIVCTEKSRGHWSHEPNECVCIDSSTGKRKKMTPEHMLTQCTASVGVVQKRRRLQNFHVTTANDGENKALEDTEHPIPDGKRVTALSGSGEIKWEAILCPHDNRGRRWHHRNNELIFALRKEFVRMSEWWPPPLPVPPPLPHNARHSELKNNPESKHNTDCHDGAEWLQASPLPPPPPIDEVKERSTAFTDCSNHRDRESRWGLGQCVTGNRKGRVELCLPSSTPSTT